MAEIDRLIGRAAADQLGLVTRRHLRSLGLTDRQIDHRRSDGRLVDVHHGVYRMPGLPPSYKRDVLAACMATGGVASHRSAAALFGLRGFERYRKSVDIAVEGRRAPRLPGVEAHTVARLERTQVGVVPVTMPRQTLVDLAHGEPRLAEGALNHALGLELVRLPALVRYLNDLGRRPGSGRLRELVELQIKGERPTESWLEDRVLECLRGYGLPEPVHQFWLQLPNGRRMRFDFAYPETRRAIEADSRLWHGTPADRRRDAERDQAARLFGWSVTRVTWVELEEQPAVLARRLALYRAAA